MTPKKSYSETLKHPFWQKKRLEVLEHHNWSCASCGDKEKTLHVHHKQYVSGRKPWEYEISELESLCEQCHSEAHESKDRINKILAQVPSDMWQSVASLIAGYLDEYIDPEFYLQTQMEFVNGGQIAWFLRNLSESDVFHARDICNEIGPDRFMQALKDAAE